MIVDGCALLEPHGGHSIYSKRDSRRKRNVLHCGDLGLDRPQR